MPKAHGRNELALRLVSDAPQEESKNNINAKFWEVSQMEYWQCERGESTLSHFLNN